MLNEGIKSPCKNLWREPYRSATVAGLGKDYKHDDSTGKEFVQLVKRR